MLRVIEYIAKSLKVIGNDTVEKGVSPYEYGNYTLWFKKNAPTLADYNCDPVQSI